MNTDKIERAKKILFDDAISERSKIYKMKTMFDHIKDITDRKYVEGALSCGECRYSDYNGDCVLKECCYLEGSIDWDLRWEYKAEDDNDDYNDD